MASGARRNLHLVGNTQNLVDVDVVTLGIDLRVVLVENGGVQLVGVGDFIAGVTLNHDFRESERVNGSGTKQSTVNSVAVFALISEANGLPGREVRTLRVDDPLVNGSNLVPALREERHSNGANERIEVNQSYVETFCDAEILSQVSPGWTVY